MLSLQEFDILNFLFKNQDKEYTQEKISNNTKISFLSDRLILIFESKLITLSNDSIACLCNTGINAEFIF